jgi:hypothetical protein
MQNHLLAGFQFPRFLFFSTGMGAGRKKDGEAAGSKQSPWFHRAL